MTFGRCESKFWLSYAWCTQMLGHQQGRQKIWWSWMWTPQLKWTELLVAGPHFSSLTTERIHGECTRWRHTGMFHSVPPGNPGIFPFASSFHSRKKTRSPKTGSWQSNRNVSNTLLYPEETGQLSLDDWLCWELKHLVHVMHLGLKFTAMAHFGLFTPESVSIQMFMCGLMT